jgi:hypothetical protein
MGALSHKTVLLSCAIVGALAVLVLIIGILTTSKERYANTIAVVSDVGTLKPVSKRGIEYSERPTLEDCNNTTQYAQACEQAKRLLSTDCNQGKIDERLFCAAVIAQDKNICMFISMNWYAKTCEGFLEKNIMRCMDIPNKEERALCIADLALNTNADCSMLEKPWQTLCQAHRKGKPGMCETIQADKIKKICRDLFEITEKNREIE